MKIDISLIKLDPNQPRKIINEQAIIDLSQSMKVEGLIHPIEIDENYQIVVGERRYRAAKLLGWNEISVNINKKDMTSYERLRRQMAENLQQSGAKHGGESMNAIDTAKGWVRLYELLTGKNYSGPEQFTGGRGIEGPFKQIADEVGVSKETVWTYLKLLDNPKYVMEDILKGRPSSYYQEAQSATGKLKNKILQKISQGDYNSGKEVRRDIRLAKTDSEIGDLELERQKSQESILANRILNGVVALALSMEAHPLHQVDPREKGIVINQLNWLKEKIELYLKNIV